MAKMKIVATLLFAGIELWACTGLPQAAGLPAAPGTLPLQCPALRAPAPERTPGTARAWAPAAEQPNGIATAYVGGNLQRDFRVSGRFALPEESRNRGMFYTDWLMLIPNAEGEQPFVQIELMRWREYRFREEIAVTWRLPGGVLTYADTTIFPKAGEHQLAIAVRSNEITLEADGRAICRAERGTFFSDALLPRLYVQVGSEVDRAGDRVVGTVRDLQRKTDDDDAERPVEIRCQARRYGVEWVDGGGGSLRAHGTFDPEIRAIRRGGIDPAKPCVWPD